MNKPRRIFAWLLPVLVAFGCASGNTDSPRPRPHTGYVDLYSPGNPELCWDVRDVSASGVDAKIIHSDLKPMEGEVLRLSLTPGRHRLRMTLLNKVISTPAEVEVDVENGRVLPLRVTLAEAGATTVMSKQRSRGNTFYGRAGRRTKVTSDESPIYELSITPEPVLPFLAKDQTPYANPIQ